MDKDNVTRLLKAYSKKTIQKPDLENLFNSKSDEELFNLICDNRELLEPIIRSKTNGNRKFPIYMKYRVSLLEDQQEDYSEEIGKLHPMLQANGWLRAHPLEYKKYMDQLNQMNTYLFSCKSNEEAISRKERSFSIFNEEKTLDEVGIRSLLSHVDIDEKKLAFYDTPEYCLNDYILERKADMTLLICENKDIWFNIRRLMFEEEKRSFLGIKIDGVVLGSGNRICEKKCLSTYTNFMKAQSVSYFYWGDIDREGLDIYLRLKRENPNLLIELFMPGYEKMLLLSKDTKLPNSADNREHKNTYEEIYSLFEIEKADLLKEYINQNKRLPQEIISYTILKNN
ncbi:MAG: DUF2220 family protein [Candidatus Pacebacteria bacterium]|nr:DUF2220 family protein [Candidatus Paceibacterota bacterium]